MRKNPLLLMVLMTMFTVGLRAEVVFSGEHNVGSWNAKQLPVGNYAVLAKASAGDVIAVTLTAVEYRYIFAKKDEKIEKCITMSSTRRAWSRYHAKIASAKTKNNPNYTIY